MLRSYERHLDIKLGKGCGLTQYFIAKPWTDLEWRFASTVVKGSAELLVKTSSPLSPWPYIYKVQ